MQKLPEANIKYSNNSHHRNQWTHNNNNNPGDLWVCDQKYNMQKEPSMEMELEGCDQVRAERC